MSELVKLLTSNEVYSKDFKHSGLAIPPSKMIAIVACMDARLTIENVLGLSTGEAHIIRNAGGIATDDAIRSLLISHELLGTEEFLVINHTDCGMLTFTDQDLQQKLAQKYNLDASGLKFHSFPNLEDNVRDQVNKIKSTPFLPNEIPVYGLTYDVKTGKLRRIV
jgi:carbonic anhydrase